MTHNHAHTGPTLPTLSPEALAALPLPLNEYASARHAYVLDRHAAAVIIVQCSVSDAVNAEIAAFIAAALNELLTPASPAQPISIAEELARR